MNRFYVLVLICLAALGSKGQTAVNAAPATMPFGKVSKEDLEMKTCDFEPDANAEILFDKADVSFEIYSMVKRHIRIKIFNDKGKNEANFKIRYINFDGIEMIADMEAEIFNLKDGQIEVTKLDKKNIYKQADDKYYNTISFAFPNVQPGSIVEFKYTLASTLLSVPDWYFQSHLPTRYSQIKTDIPSNFNYKHLERVTQPYVINTEDVKALANIPSLGSEPYMGALRDNLQRINFLLTSVVSTNNNFSKTATNWAEVGKSESRALANSGQLDKGLTGERSILDKAKQLKTVDEKIAFIFNEVKNDMKWNEIDRAYFTDGTAEAWDKKIGNSTEVNGILCHLLRKAGINAIPMKVSTRDNGKVNPAFPDRFSFNRLVDYLPLDSDKYYILDATDKFNLYNETPPALLNGMGLYLDEEHEKYDLLFLQKTEQVKQTVSISAEIKPEGKMIGAAHINSYSYNRINSVKKYKTDGEKKYSEYLQDNDNNMRISSLKFENMEVDTLPLLQVVGFNLDLAGSDENYIYFNANLFTGFRKNLFLSEKRYTDIDFSYNNTYVVNGIFKLPAGYKVDALPKSAIMNMPDNSITFKRIVAEEDGVVTLRCTVIFKKSVYFKENYPEFRDFFKRMYEMLNEQVVLKKT